MKTNISALVFRFSLAVLLLLSLRLPCPAFNLLGTAFTYQGRLNDANGPINGTYDLLFTIYDSTNDPGTVVFGPITNSATAVSNGLFTVRIDFGTNIYIGNWLEIGVRANGSDPFTTLTPRQELTLAPYSLLALNAASLVGTLPASQLSGPYTNALSFTNPANAFGGNGSGLTNVNAAKLGGIGTNGFWQTRGNAGTIPGVNFIGTTDNQPLELQVNGTRALRIEPHAISAPSLAGGYYQNSVASFYGAAITGGGASAAANGVSGNYAFIGAGYGGNAGSNSAVIAGAYNASPGNYAFIGTGLSNTNLADYSFIGSGTTNYIATPASYSVIGGGRGNRVSNIIATVSGGFANLAAFQGTTIGGGENNTASGSDATVAGGNGNTASGAFAAVGGGVLNEALGFETVVAGGYGNIASNAFASVAGGYFNRALGPAGTIGGGYTNIAAGDYATVSGGYSNLASGVGATIAGGGFNGDLPGANIASGGGSFIGGGINNIAGAGNSVIAGGANNIADVNASAIAGGSENHVSGDHSFIGGGQANFAGDAYDTIGGGWANTIQANALASFIGGGLDNTATSNFATVCGGEANVAGGFSATVAGGAFNVASNDFATVSGGISNTAAGKCSFAAGQQAQASHQGSFVWADSHGAPFASTANDQFSVRAQGGVRFFTSGVGLTVDGQPVLVGGGGSGVTIQQNSSGGPNVIEGSPYNFVVGGVVGGTISGGGVTNYGPSSSSYTNSVIGDFGTVSGGRQNTSGGLCVVGGGDSNSSSGDSATVSGGLFNKASGAFPSIGGGLENWALAEGAVIGGGFGNIANNPYATICGGYQNAVSNNFATVCGGEWNVASGQYSFAAGREAQALHKGSFVWADSQGGQFDSTANDQFSVRAQGGVRLVTGGNGPGSQTIFTNGNLGLGTATPAGLLEIQGGADWNGAADPHAIALSYRLGGYRHWIRSRHNVGAVSGNSIDFFVNTSSSSDGSSAPGAGNVLNLTLDNGNVGIGNATPTNRLHVMGGATFQGPGGSGTQFVVWTPGSGSWSFTSDRNTKDRVTPVNPTNVLEKLSTIPINEWSYIGYEQRHIGPMAQDFHDQFPLNNNDKALNDADLHGVALAAIQGLNQKVDEKEAEIQSLKQRNESLEQRLNELEALVKQLKNRL